MMTLSGPWKHPFLCLCMPLRSAGSLITCIFLISHHEGRFSFCQGRCCGLNASSSCCPHAVPKQPTRFCLLLTATIIRGDAVSSVVIIQGLMRDAGSCLWSNGHTSYVTGFCKPLCRGISIVAPSNSWDKNVWFWMPELFTQPSNGFVNTAVRGHNYACFTWCSARITQWLFKVNQTSVHIVDHWRGIWWIDCVLPINAAPNGALILSLPQGRNWEL